MSFFDTLKSMGLFQPQQGQPAQQNPYGLDPATMRQARMDALGNIGGQILAMSQQMTPDQRARMMANADWTGGYQNSLYNAAQMQLMGQASQRKQKEQERITRARTMLAEQIKGMPAGPAQDAAMYFFEAGDLTKAGEVLFTRKKTFDPTAADYVTTDYFGNPVSVAPTPSSASAAPVSAQPPAATAEEPASPTPIPSPDSTGVSTAGQTDRLTMNWRRLTGDPSLSPTEAQYIASVAAAEGNPAAGLKAYREIIKQRTDDLNKDQDQAQTLKTANVNASEKLRTDYDTAGKAYNTVISAAEYAANVAQQPQMSPSDKLAVLYNYIKTLDPLGAVRDSDVELAQSIQPVVSRIEQLFKSVSEGGTISDAAILQIARTMAGLGNDARGRMGRKEQEIRRIATARGVNPNMVFGEPMRGPQGPPAPIGYRIPRTASDQAVNLPPDDESFVSTWGAQ